jgi:hypothetical protein
MVVVMVMATKLKWSNRRCKVEKQATSQSKCRKGVIRERVNMKGG